MYFSAVRYFLCKSVSIHFYGVDSDVDQKLCTAVCQDAYCVTGLKNAYNFAVARCFDHAVRRFNGYCFSKNFGSKGAINNLVIWNNCSVYRSI